MQVGYWQIPTCILHHDVKMGCRRRRHRRCILSRLFVDKKRIFPGEKMSVFQKLRLMFPKSGCVLLIFLVQNTYNFYDFIELKYVLKNNARFNLINRQL